MTSAFANGLRMVGNKRIPTPKKPVIPAQPPLQGTQPVAPPVSPMTVPGQTVQQQVPVVTPQVGTQGSLIKDVLKRKRMLEI